MRSAEKGECSMSTKRQSWLAMAGRPCSMASMILLMRVRSWARASGAATPAAIASAARPATTAGAMRRALVG